MKKFLRFTYFSICSMVMLSSYASAYIDPSTATYLVQIIAGVLIAAGSVAGFLWHKLKRAVKKKNKPDEAVPSADPQADDKDEDEAD